MRKTIALAALFPIAISVLGVVETTAASAADGLTITSFGGAYQTSQRKTYFEPFTAKTGVKITEEEYNGEIAKLRAMVETNNVTWDVVDVDTQTGQQGCDEGIFLTLDYSKIQPKDKYIDRAATDCAVANMVYSTVVAYDGDKLQDGPTGPADFFDLKKFPGKRALWKNPNSNLELALMADGVPSDKVYETLQTPEGVDRAFAVEVERPVGDRLEARPPQSLGVVALQQGAEGLDTEG